MSAWGNYFQSGSGTTAAGQIGQGVAQYSSLMNQAAAYDIAGSQARASEKILGTQLGMLSLKRSQIELDAINERVLSHEKWLSRRGTVKAGFAARGIKVDASARNDSPALLMAMMLSNIDEEGRQIELNRQLRTFNEVSLPGYQIEGQMAMARYQSRVAEINEKHLRRAAYAAMVASVAKAASSSYSGSGGGS